MDYQNTNKTNATTTEKGNLEKEVESIGMEINRLTGIGERTTALKLYQQQTPDVQKKIRMKYLYAVKSTQFGGI